MTIEQMKKTRASISFHMKPDLKFGLKHIDVPKDFIDYNNIPRSKAIQYKLFTDPERIEEILISSKRQHLQQDQGTLFTISEVIKCTGIDGSFESTDFILQGNADTLVSSQPVEDNIK